MFYKKIQEAVDFILKRIKTKPTIAIILGSGLGSLVDNIKDKEIISYKEIPHFLDSKVQGHEYQLVFGKMGNNQVVALQGRFHLYEGYDLKDITFPIYVLNSLGVKKIIVTNACGGINEKFKPGDLMIIEDHINLTGHNPLIGENDDSLGPRFLDMSEPYSNDFISYACKIADKLNIKYQKGVYALYTGPSYETAAEIRAYKVLGADAIGMSTVPEVIVANYLKMQVLGISCITNMATGIAKEKHSHEEVLKVASQASQNLCLWVENIIKGLKI